jgi:hypothetical protein
MLTQQRLKEVLNYDHKTGLFVRNNSNDKRQVGNVMPIKGYIRIKIDCKLYLAHRLAWMYMTGSFPTAEIDHINGDGGDNRFVNLRDVTRSENNKNQKKSISNTTGITGVHWFKPQNKWRSRICIDNKDTNIGYFDNLFDAVCARKNAEIKHGFHKNHGSDRSLLCQK